ncbi:MAG: sigma-70 family RNA polymerase sigma factor [Woeseiaceae bacterium]|nr:sigma-70 family RNA polymerase sigma factor [Woeseiaceae bacterium]
MRQQLARLGGGAHALAIQILGNSEDAADAVHDAFAVVLAKPGAYDARKGPLRPWFLKVVRNRCLDMLRRRRATGPDPDELAAGTASPEQAAGEAERSAAITLALGTLPAERREIVILRDYLDLSYAEIAEVLGVAPGTVMSRLHRARLALKEALKAYEP